MGYFSCISHLVLESYARGFCLRVSNPICGHFKMRFLAPWTAAGPGEAPALCENVSAGQALKGQYRKLCLSRQCCTCDMREMLVDLFFSYPECLGKFPGCHIPLLQQRRHLLAHGLRMIRIFFSLQWEPQFQWDRLLLEKKAAESGGYSMGPLSHQHILFAGDYFVSFVMNRRSLKPAFSPERESPRSFRRNLR